MELHQDRFLVLETTASEHSPELKESCRMWDCQSVGTCDQIRGKTPGNCWIVCSTTHSDLSVILLISNLSRANSSFRRHLSLPSTPSVRTTSTTFSSLSHSSHGIAPRSSMPLPARLVAICRQRRSPSNFFISSNQELLILRFNSHEQ